MTFRGNDDPAHCTHSASEFIDQTNYFSFFSTWSVLNILCKSLRNGGSKSPAGPMCTLTEDKIYIKQTPLSAESEIGAFRGSSKTTNL